MSLDMYLKPWRRYSCVYERALSRRQFSVQGIRPALQIRSPAPLPTYRRRCSYSISAFPSFRAPLFFTCHLEITKEHERAIRRLLLSEENLSASSRFLLASCIFVLLRNITLYYYVMLSTSLKTSKHFAAGISCVYAIIILSIGFLGYWQIRDLSDIYKLIGVGSFIVLYGFAFSGPLPLINAMTADISDKLTIEVGENIFEAYSGTRQFGLNVHSCWIERTLAWLRVPGIQLL